MYSAYVYCTCMHAYSYFSKLIYSSTCMHGCTIHTVHTYIHIYIHNYIQYVCTPYIICALQSCKNVAFFRKKMNKSFFARAGRGGGANPQMKKKITLGRLFPKEIDIKKKKKNLNWGEKFYEAPFFQAKREKTRSFESFGVLCI